MMPALSPRQQLTIAAVLGLFVLFTRSQHFAGLHNLPGASWAAFFLAGVYLRPTWALPALLGLVWLLDFAAFAWGGGSGFCLTRAYAFLLPAYAALWSTGRWYARRHRFALPTLMPLGTAVLVGAVVAELFSSGGFYFFSGRFPSPSLAGFGDRLMQYFPPMLQGLAYYVVIVVLVHVALGSTRARVRFGAKVK